MLCAVARTSVAVRIPGTSGTETELACSVVMPPPRVLSVIGARLGSRWPAAGRSGLRR